MLQDHRDASGDGAEINGVRELLTESPSTRLDIAESEDDVLILASTVVIDAACHDTQQRT